MYIVLCAYVYLFTRNKFSEVELLVKEYSGFFLEKFCFSAFQQGLWMPAPSLTLLPLSFNLCQINGFENMSFNLLSFAYW